MWQECPEFARERRHLEGKFSLPHYLWVSQPRLTSKSGWITYQAGPSPMTRARYLAATCELALCILRRGLRGEAGVLHRFDIEG
eukprot:6236947-Pyramimonas_sp.AAC.1